ncbi:MAG: DUF4296 domain-containing protein [Muribaculaceae bacterium]|nr:DUF4296 domain-containing protein [Muribaculaceae bacterium]
MKHVMPAQKSANAWCIVLGAVLCTALYACDKAPNGIISESRMVDLLVDLYQADAYLESYPTQFPDDSTKMSLKQAVYAKHGVTQADYDTSLVWYAHNMDVYSDVYRRVVDKLNHEREHIDVDAKPVKQENSLSPPKPYLAAKGDTADLWQQPRLWLLTQGLGNGYLPFEADLDDNSAAGNRYEIKFKALAPPKCLAVVLAADYSDGTTALVTRNAIINGWNTVTLQTDTARRVNRVYGYVHYTMPTGQTAYLDSVQLLRTHLDKAKYATVASRQRIIERKDSKTQKTDKAEPVEPVEPVAWPDSGHRPPHVAGPRRFTPVRKHR